MTRRCVTDEQYGRLCRRTGELARLSWKVWKTIQIGTGLKTADEFRQTLKDGGFKISDWANDIMGKPGFSISSEKIELDLVVVSVADLGFPDGAKLDQIYKRAKSLGLALCPPEVGPQLRLQYKDQPKGEWLRVAMEPIIDSVGDPFVFFVVHVDGVLLLNTYYDISGSVWSPGYRWVFVLRK